LRARQARRRARQSRHQRGHSPVTEQEIKSLVFVSADLKGIGSGALRDSALLSGLLIAAAGAAGLSAVGVPHVRVSPTGEVSAVLLLDPCHVSVHSLPERGLALVDVFAQNESGAAKALDVFVRRLAPTGVASDTRKRG
jgi:S-adenosylmethionine decarboxylase